MKLLSTFLQEVRLFLEPLWIEAHKEWNEIDVIPSKNMCRYSCLFLKEILNFHNYGKWEIKLGRPDIEKEGSPESMYGYRFDDKWYDHAWLIKDIVLIDITADQFGGSSIYIGKIDDPSYKANLTEKDALSDLKTLEIRVNKWINEWQCHIKFICDANF